MTRARAIPGHGLRGVGFIVLLGGVWLGALAFRHGALPGVAGFRSEAAGYVPNARLAAGRELLMVFVGTSRCGACRDPELPALVGRAKLLARERASGERAQFRAVGVSIDWDQGEGIAFLESFGPFDQVSVGSNWLNEAAVKYIWRDLPGRPAVPQVIFVTRTVELNPTGISVGGETLVKRLAGKEEIAAWVRSGGSLALERKESPES